MQKLTVYTTREVPYVQQSGRVVAWAYVVSWAHHPGCKYTAAVEVCSSSGKLLDSLIESFDALSCITSARLRAQGIGEGRRGGTPAGAADIAASTKRQGTRFRKRHTHPFCVSTKNALKQISPLIATCPKHTRLWSAQDEPNAGCPEHVASTKTAVPSRASSDAKAWSRDARE